MMNPFGFHHHCFVLKPKKRFIKSHDPVNRKNPHFAIVTRSHRYVGSALFSAEYGAHQSSKLERSSKHHAPNRGSNNVIAAGRRVEAWGLELLWSLGFEASEASLRIQVRALPGGEVAIQFRHVLEYGDAGQ